MLSFCYIRNQVSQKNTQTIYSEDHGRAGASVLCTSSPKNPLQLSRHALGVKASS